MVYSPPYYAAYERNIRIARHLPITEHCLDLFTGWLAAILRRMVSNAMDAAMCSGAGKEIRTPDEQLGRLAAHLALTCETG